MFPIISINNALNSSLVDIKQGCNFLKLNTLLSKLVYFNNIKIIEFSIVIIGTNLTSVSSFFNHVLSVFLMRSSDKVGNINTPWIIAFVHQNLSFWDCFVFNCPRHTMSHKTFSAMPYSAISTIRHRSNKLPTSTKFWNVGRNRSIFIQSSKEFLSKCLAFKSSVEEVLYSGIHSAVSGGNSLQGNCSRAIQIYQYQFQMKGKS